MKDLTPFANKDFKLIKWQLVFALVAITLSAGMFLGANYLEEEAISDLRASRAEYERARSSVELIEEEEATIVEYIGRYQEFSNNRVVATEDRLQILEIFAEIRADNSLFPIDLSIDEQKSLRLSYDRSVREPGGPIDLKYSSINLSLALLHEDDLSRLLSAITERPGLYQIQECTITIRNANTTNFYVLAQHQSAECTVLWYTFDLDPENQQAGL